jgi:hypothetical protein
MRFSARRKEDCEIVPCEIVVAGKVVGDLTPTLERDGSVRWHACIKLGGCQNIGVGLLQGFGDSHDLAIADAIARGRAEAKNHARLTEEFVSAIGFEP